MAIRSGEPFRLQIYEFLHTLAQGGLQSQLSNMHLSNGEDQGAGGTVGDTDCDDNDDCYAKYIFVIPRTLTCLDGKCVARIKSQVFK
ncbi:hypothetical protein P8452_59907 [Trifolium repens]|nr:hypothetical protein P8452_59907 [Trifolium repens]